MIKIVAMESLKQNYSHRTVEEVVATVVAAFIVSEPVETFDSCSQDNLNVQKIEVKSTTRIQRNPGQ